MPDDLNNEHDQQTADGDTRNKSSSHAAENRSPPNSHKVSDAKIIAAIAALDGGVSIVFWAFSEFFGAFGHRTLSVICFYVFIVTALAGASYALYKFWPQFRIIVGSYVAVSLLLGWVVYAVATERRDEAFPQSVSNLLTPGNESDPAVLAELLATVPPERAAEWARLTRSGLKIFVGPNVGCTSLKSQAILAIDGQLLLSIDRKPSGISVDAKVFDSDGKIVVQVENNKFFVNQNAAFRVDRPDAHSLIVYDNRADKVLDIWYLNKSSIRVNGIFRYKNLRPFVITDTSLIDPTGGQYRGSLFGDAGRVLLEFDSTHNAMHIGAG